MRIVKSVYGTCSVKKILGSGKSNYVKGFLTSPLRRLQNITESSIYFLSVKRVIK